MLTAKLCAVSQLWAVDLTFVCPCLSHKTEEHRGHPFVSRCAEHTAGARGSLVHFCEGRDGGSHLRLPRARTAAAGFQRSLGSSARSAGGGRARLGAAPRGSAGLAEVALGLLREPWRLVRRAPRSLLRQRRGHRALQTGDSRNHEKFIPHPEGHEVTFAETTLRMEDPLPIFGVWSNRPC